MVPKDIENPYQGFPEVFGQPHSFRDALLSLILHPTYFILSEIGLSQSLAKQQQKKIKENYALFCGANKLWIMED